MKENKHLFTNVYFYLYITQYSILPAAPVLTLKQTPPFLTAQRLLRED